MKRLGYALVGAFMGAIISFLPLAWVFGFNGRSYTFFIGIILCAMIGAVLSAVFGKQLIIFIRDYLLWPWG